MNPTIPYTTFAPASCSRVARSMLAASSKRARSSTTAVTSLPERAASISPSTSGELASVRYTVCLIASTLGSWAAFWTSSTTGAKDS